VSSAPEVSRGGSKFDDDGLLARTGSGASCEPTTNHLGPKLVQSGVGKWRHSRRVTYDDASWHVDSVLEHGLDPSCAATHIGMFFAWLANRGLVDPFMLTSAGALFKAAAYDAYLRNYKYIPAVARGGDPSYVAPDTWELYDAVAPAIDRAYRLHSER
jgi:hypothetical protein